MKEEEGKKKSEKTRKIFVHLQTWIEYYRENAFILSQNNHIWPNTYYTLNIPPQTYVWVCLVPKHVFAAVTSYVTKKEMRHCDEDCRPNTLTWRNERQILRSIYI